MFEAFRPRWVVEAQRCAREIRVLPGERATGLCEHMGGPFKIGQGKPARQWLVGVDRNDRIDAASGAVLCDTEQPPSRLFREVHREVDRDQYAVAARQLLGLGVEFLDAGIAAAKGSLDYCFHV